jgi:hypothetical protein
MLTLMDCSLDSYGKDNVNVARLYPFLRLVTGTTQVSDNSSRQSAPSTLRATDWEGIDPGHKRQPASDGLSIYVSILPRPPA